MDETAKPSNAKTQGISRREFARRAALASAVAAVAPGATVSAPANPLNEHASVAAADFGGRVSDPSGTPGRPEQQPAEIAKLSPESHAEAEARFQTILNQYGNRFSDAQKTDLHRLCALAQPPLDRLRAYPLENGDAPALYLKPLVEREKNPLENTRVGKTPAASQNP
jgi:hypothetical protein